MFAPDWTAHKRDVDCDELFHSWKTMYQMHNYEESNPEICSVCNETRHYCLLIYLEDGNYWGPLYVTKEDGFYTLPNTLIRDGRAENVSSWMIKDSSEVLSVGDKIVPEYYMTLIATLKN